MKSEGGNSVDTLPAPPAAPEEPPATKMELLQATKESNDMIFKKLDFIEGRVRAMSKDGKHWLDGVMLREAKTFHISLANQQKNMINKHETQQMKEMDSDGKVESNSSDGMLPMPPLVDSSESEMDSDGDIALHIRFAMMNFMEEAAKQEAAAKRTKTKKKKRRLEGMKWRKCKFARKKL